MKTIIAACVLFLSTTALACAGEASDDSTTTSPSAVTEGRPVRSATPGQIDDEPAFAKGREPSARAGVDVGDGAKAARVGERGSELVGDDASLRVPSSSYGSERVGDAVSPHRLRNIVAEKAIGGDLRVARELGSETVGDATLRTGEVGGEEPGEIGDLDGPSAATIATQR